MSKKKQIASRAITGGEIIFDRAVYTGIGLLANEALAMILAVEGRRMGGKPHFDKASRWWEKTRGYKDIVENGVVKKTGFEQAADSLEIFTLLLSGTALIVPMKWMEDREAKIVRNLNHLLDKLPGHYLTQEQIAARDDEVEKAIACEPKQTWGSLISGRVIATLNNMFILKETLFRGTNTDKVKDWSKNLVYKSTDKLNSLTGGNPNSIIARARRTERFKWYADLVGLETAYTVVSSLVLEVASKFIARKTILPKNPALCEQGQAEQEAKVAGQGSTTLPDLPGIDDKKFADKIAKHKSLKPMVSHTKKIADEPSSIQPSI